MKKEEKNAIEQIKAVVEDGFAEINERIYTFTAMTFSERRSVFAFLTSVQQAITCENFSFLDDSNFKTLETNIIFKRVTVDGMSLSKKNVFEEFPEDYLIFITMALTVISYPFLKGKLG